jgi:hypothetical protein
MTFLWIVAVAAFVALMVYRGHLTQHETDELFLSSSNEDSSRHQEHDDIVRRVNKLKPYCQSAGGIAALITVCIIGVEVAHIVNGIQ